MKMIINTNKVLLFVDVNVFRGCAIVCSSMVESGEFKHVHEPCVQSAASLFLPLRSSNQRRGRRGYESLALGGSGRMDSYPRGFSSQMIWTETVVEVSVSGFKLEARRQASDNRAAAVHWTWNEMNHSCHITMQGAGLKSRRVSHSRFHMITRPFESLVWSYF